LSPAEQHISADEEKARYDQHNNHPDDPDYRAFLSRIFVPMQQRLNPGSCGLDFGSGPGPTLSLMFEEAGHRMTIYDHFYAPTSSTLDQPYDFITATEVVEHLHRPGLELERLWSLLNPSGLLGVMTQLVPKSTPLPTGTTSRIPPMSASSPHRLVNGWRNIGRLSWPSREKMSCCFKNGLPPHPV
jgi:hypothetical protein